VVLVLFVTPNDVLLSKVSGILCISVTTDGWDLILEGDTLIARVRDVTSLTHDQFLNHESMSSMASSLSS
jgi:hypothetical protein